MARQIHGRPHCAGAASQFFCQPREDAVGDGDDECVYRDDTLVLLELTTRDMMEARTPVGRPVRG